VDRDIDPDTLLDAIRDAAFGLRERDPAEAVRQLRKLAKSAGPLEPLVQGALGEILLEEFDDVDGALHHFRRLVALAPSLPAGHVGLARAAARNGEASVAQDAFAAAQAGLAKLVADARAPSAPEHIADTAGEALLTALEVAVEERAFAAEFQTGRAPSPVPPEPIAWAEEARLFDDEEGDHDDWLRFARLAASYLAGAGKLDEALALAARLEQATGWSADRTANVRSFALEAAGRLPEAGAAAADAVGSLEGDFEAEEVLRAVDLLREAGDDLRADELLARLTARIEAERKRAGPEDAELLGELLEGVRSRGRKGAKALVSLGKGMRH
jgi:hypothetical protein